LRAVNVGALNSTAPTITARPTPQEKHLFAAVAAQRQISESTLALIAIRAWLGCTCGCFWSVCKTLVVKAENELGRRLHIDKQRLRDWREDFARLMREQGIAANATPRAIRGENKKYPREKIFKAQRYGTSMALHDRVMGIANELSRSRTIADPARDRLLETRRSLVSAWMKAADVLDAQGEIILAGDVRYFVKHLPPVLTDRQRLAAQFIGFVQKQRGTQRNGPERGYPKDPERTR
jgi:hypothetical protein